VLTRPSTVKPSKFNYLPQNINFVCMGINCTVVNGITREVNEKGFYLFLYSKALRTILLSFHNSLQSTVIQSFSLNITLFYKIIFTFTS